jgi:hypothetical protein
VLGLMSVASRAQVYIPPINMTPQMYNGVYDNIRNAQRGGSVDAADDGASTRIQQQSFNPRFISSKSRTRANLATFVKKARATDPAGADKMEQLFASTDIIDQIGSAIAPHGLRTDNAAHAYAVWWMTAWQAAQGSFADFDQQTAQAVAIQARRALASSAQLTGASDAQKQEMAEAMLVQSALIEAAKDQYKSDAKMMAKLASAVKKGAAASGLDLGAMILTPKGFVPARN